LALIYGGSVTNLISKDYITIMFYRMLAYQGPIKWDHPGLFSLSFKGPLNDGWISFDIYKWATKVKSPSIVLVFGIHD
jgi:hypothetical protein